MLHKKGSIECHYISQRRKVGDLSKFSNSQSENAYAYEKIFQIKIFSFLMLYENGYIKFHSISHRKRVKNFPKFSFPHKRKNLTCIKKFFRQKFPNFSCSLKMAQCKISPSSKLC